MQREHKKKGFFSDGTTTVHDYSKAWKAPRIEAEDIFKEQTGNVGY